MYIHTYIYTHTYITLLLTYIITYIHTLHVHTLFIIAIKTHTLHTHIYITYIHTYIHTHRTYFLGSKKRDKQDWLAEEGSMLAATLHAVAELDSDYVTSDGS
jgi:hypothetical protein